MSSTEVASACQHPGITVQAYKDRSTPLSAYARSLRCPVLTLAYASTTSGHLLIIEQHHKTVPTRLSSYAAPSIALGIVRYQSYLRRDVRYQLRLCCDQVEDEVVAFLGT
eukprot:2478278-Rhodomonas_salina.2